MSIEPYTTGDGAKAMELCRPSGVRSSGYECTLRIKPNRLSVGWCAGNEDGLLVNPLHPDDALAVIRDHFRAKLAERGVWLEVRPGDKWRVWRRYTAFAEGDTYDEALIAAALAVYGKEGAA